jgi:predicted nucleotidyltransferase component of viral defense system
MISAEERRERAAALGVPESQIAQDHLISHVLKALSESGQEDLTFFGGTALCRTWCLDTRLSEDVDLLVDDNIQASERLPELISRGIRREYPVVRWTDAGRRHQVDTRILEVEGGATLQVQFAQWRDGWRILPVVAAPVRLRYSDLPEQVILRVPTAPAFVTMKLIAWGDRQAPRDLFDLHDLAQRGLFTPEVPIMFRELTACMPSSVVVRGSLPRGVELSWESELGHQLTDLPAPWTCLDTVCLALERLASTRR